MKYALNFLFVLTLVLLATNRADANSAAMHGAYSLDFFLNLEDPNYHPELSAEDRENLRFKKGADGRFLFELSNAQISFMTGANLPDSAPLMKLSHNVMPSEIIDAIGELKSVLPYEFEQKLPLRTNLSSKERLRRQEERQFILDQQRYIAMGAQTHFLSDEEVLSLLAGYKTEDQIRIANLRGETMRDRLFETYTAKFGLNQNELKSLKKLSGDYGAWKFRNTNDSALGSTSSAEIQDKFLDMLLDVVEGDPFKHGSHTTNAMAKSAGLFNYASGNYANSDYPNYESIPEKLKLNGNQENERNQQRIAECRFFGKTDLSNTDKDTGKRIDQNQSLSQIQSFVLNESSPLEQLTVKAAKDQLKEGLMKVRQNQNSVLTVEQRRQMRSGSNESVADVIPKSTLERTLKSSPTQNYNSYHSNSGLSRNDGNGSNSTERRSTSGSISGFLPISTANTGTPSNTSTASDFVHSSGLHRSKPNNSSNSSLKVTPKTKTEKLAELNKQKTELINKKGNYLKEKLKLENDKEKLKEQLPTSDPTKDKTIQDLIDWYDEKIKDIDDKITQIDKEIAEVDKKIQEVQRGRDGLPLKRSYYNTGK